MNVKTTVLLQTFRINKLPNSGIVRNIAQKTH